MPKCDLNKLAKKLYWNHTLAWMFSCKFVAYFQNTFFSEDIWRAPSIAICKNLQSFIKLFEIYQYQLFWFQTDVGVATGGVLWKMTAHFDDKSSGTSPLEGLGGSRPPLPLTFLYLQGSPVISGKIYITNSAYSLNIRL